MRYLLIIPLLLFSKCKSQQAEEVVKSDYKILNTVIANEQVKIFNELSFSKYKPIKYLNRYNNQLLLHGKDNRHDSLMHKLNGKTEWIFTQSDIEFISQKYQSWNKFKWNFNYIINDEIELNNTNNVLYNSNIPIYTISQPLYNKDRNKAMIIIAEQKSKKDVFLRLILLNKNNSEWEIVGRLWFGHH